MCNRRSGDFVQDGVSLMIALPALLLATAAVSAGPPADDDILEKARKALLLRSELLLDYSVEVTSESIIETPRGARETEVRERQYYGGPDEFRREVLRMKQNGALVNPATAGQGGGRRGLGGFGQQLQRRDPLTLEGFFRQPRVVGSSEIDSKPAVQIKLKPKVKGLQVKDAELWVDPETGMPLRLELRIGAGPLGSDAHLELQFAYDPRSKITVRRSQHLSLSMRGFGGGGGRAGMGQGPQSGVGIDLKTATAWRKHEWGLSFEENFFSEAPDPSPRSGGRGGGRGGGNRSRQTATAEEDPFEEIRIAPRGNIGQELSVGGRGTEEVLIEGGSVGSGGRGRSEGDIVARLMGGGGGGGRGGRGGLRAARIAGGRANRVQGSFTAGLSSSALDARPYSLDGAETPEPDYLTWNSGVSIGGPLGPAPTGSSGGGFGFQRTRRAAFFVDFNISRGQQLQSQYGAVPTPLERQGDFSQTSYTSGPLAGTGVELFDPLTGQPYPGAILPAAQLDPSAAGFLGFIPLPNRDDPFLNYYTQQNLDNNSERLNLRFSVPLPGSLRLSASYGLNQNRGDVFHPFPDLGSQRDRRGQNLSLRFNQTAQAGLVHSFGVTWNRNKNQSLNPFAFEQDISADLGIENTSPDPIDYGLTTMQFTNYSAPSDGSSSSSIGERSGLNDSLLWVRGNHFFRFGGEVIWRRRNNLSNPEGAGSLTFAGVATSAYEGGQPVPATGYDFADFLLGLAQSSRIQYGNSDHYLRRKEFAVFVNDNWRATSRFTLQWGLRYQYAAPWIERYDRIANLDVSPDLDAAETVTPGSLGSYHGQFPRALVESDWNNLAPRLALAYRLRSGRKASVLRASYGVFFPNETYDYLSNELISQPPFGFTVQETAGQQEFLDIQTAFSADLVQEVPNTYAVEPLLRLPTVQNWGFSWQQSLPRNFFFSLGYAGTRGTGLELLRAPNRLTEDGQQIEEAAQFLYLTSAASSVFHGLQALAVRRMRSGFSMSFQYEFGKSLDNASAISGGQRIVAQNDDDLDSERGRSNFDERHRLTMSGFWELPLGDRHRWLRGPGWASSALENWFMRGSLTAATGRPRTARALGNQINNSGTASQASERASATGEQVSLPASERSTREWFNTGAFLLPAPGSFGDAGRNTIDGPGSWVINLNLAKSIPLGSDGRRLLLMVNMANLLNHPNFSGFNNTVNSVGFGQVTGVGSMRSIRLSFRFMF